MTTAWWLFVAMNVIVVAIAVLSSSCARPSSLPLTPRHRSGVTSRASSVSAVLQSLLSFSLFSFPSACLSSYLQPDAAADATTDQETDQTEELELVARSSSPIRPRPSPSPSPSPSPRALQLTPPPAAPAADEKEVEDEEDPNGMSMDEAYALVLASQQRPERERRREEEARRSEVDAKAEEFIRRFREELRQQRLNSISNYTQMLRRQAPAASSGRRRPDVPQSTAD